jgi:hypothetical protein
VQPIGDFASRGITGVDVGYGAPWEGNGWRLHGWRNRPCCFLHFDVFVRHEGARFIPSGARPASMAGHRGLLVEAHEGSFYGNGLYWANHVRFLWRQDGIPYVATLHTFGERPTERLLARIVSGLRPVADLSRSRPQGTRVGVTPNAIVSGARSIWVAALGDMTSNFHGTVYGIDRRSGRVKNRLRVGAGPHALTQLDGALWTATYNAVTRIQIRTGKPIAIIDTGGWPRALAAGAKAIWVVNASPFVRRGSLTRLDPRTNRASTPLALGRSPVAVATTRDAVWVVDELDGTLTRVDPSAWGADRPHSPRSPTRSGSQIRATVRSRESMRTRTAWWPPSASAKHREPSRSEPGPSGLPAREAGASGGSTGQPTGRNRLPEVSATRWRSP